MCRGDIDRLQCFKIQPAVFMSDTKHADRVQRAIDHGKL